MKSARRKRKEEKEAKKESKKKAKKEANKAERKAGCCCGGGKAVEKYRAVEVEEEEPLTPSTANARAQAHAAREK